MLITNPQEVKSISSTRKIITNTLKILTNTRKIITISEMYPIMTSLKITAAKIIIKTLPIKS